MSRPPRTAAVWISTSIILAWCSWIVMGGVGHYFPTSGIHNLKFAPTRHWPDGHHIFPSFDHIDHSFTFSIVALAFVLLFLQLFAIVLRYRLVGFMVGVAFTVLGLPMLCLHVLFLLVPIAKLDTPQDLVWDTFFPLAMFGSWTIAGLCMIFWGSRSARGRPTEYVGKDATHSPLSSF